MSHDGHGGMDMSMDGSTSMEMGHMIPYLHFTPGDILWFLGWVPNSVGSMIGASIGLFMLALIERWMSMCKSLMEAHWGSKTNRNKPVTSRDRPHEQGDPFAHTEIADGKDGLTTAAATAGVLPTTPLIESHAQSGSRIEVQTREHGPGGPGRIRVAGLKNQIRSAPPFVWTHDSLRGAMHATHAALGYALMLSVMSYNVAFIISICVGLGVGEVLFGRYGTHQHVG